jgi:hypothetical protein
MKTFRVLILLIFQFMDAKEMYIAFSKEHQQAYPKIGWHII